MPGKKQAGIDWLGFQNPFSSLLCAFGALRHPVKSYPVDLNYPVFGLFSGNQSADSFVVLLTFIDRMSTIE